MHEPLTIIQAMKKNKIKFSLFFLEQVMTAGMTEVHFLTRPLTRRLHTSLYPGNRELRASRMTTYTATDLRHAGQSVQ